MKPQEVLGRETTPDGEQLILYRRGPDYTIRVGGWELMSSRAHGSEDDLARLACGGNAQRRRPEVLIGGLGMGFTLRAALDLLPVSAKLTVVEIFSAVVEWNRSYLGHLSDHPLSDPRVCVVCDDIRRVLETTGQPWDAILLDVDNGPEALTLGSNQRLYTSTGLDRVKSALRRGGCLAVWSASPDQAFERRLRHAGFTVEVHNVRGGPRGRGVRHVVYLAIRNR